MTPQRPLRIAQTAPAILPAPPVDAGGTEPAVANEDGAVSDCRARGPAGPRRRPINASAGRA
ncbi:MAG TPA: hypothetical protein VFJ08_06540 [Salinisphaera sp.]|nr:hypothetical protein [Salinisphaera sp.]